MSADVVAIIPARGGSTRIPRKNAKDFNGKPIIAWPLEACIELDAISQIVVSTDDDGLARISHNSGATTVIDRPAELATDTAGTAPVIKHAIDELGVDDDTLVMCLYPTATLTPHLVSEALGLAREHPDKFVVSVGRHRSPHERSLQRLEGDLMSLASPDHLLTRTQDLPQRYFDAGKLYVARASVWKARETMMEKPFVPFHLPDWAAVDIDEPDDWAVAEALHRVFVLESS
ncbi:MAG: acylneuraminate cytidylyltransferase family protein [Candidatus Nanopelagicales bacterium]|nr:acylneuraminate cytidylyltransferase family protein [Candidatus Nanopelagicales bacterium]